MAFAAWREIPVNMVTLFTLAGAFDNRKWCVRTEGLSGDDAHSDTDGNSGDDQGSDDDGYSGDDQGSDDAADSGDDDFKEPITDDGHQRMVFLGPLNSAGVLAREINELTSPLATQPKRSLDMSAFEASQLIRRISFVQYIDWRTNLVLRRESWLRSIQVSPALFRCL